MWGERVLLQCVRARYHHRMAGIQTLVTSVHKSLRANLLATRALVLRQMHAARARANHQLARHLRSRGWRLEYRGEERTTYVIGLFGTGRWYINQLLIEHLGLRAQYFRDGIRVHPGPTPMIYSGHCTMKYPCRDQQPPGVTARVLESVRAGFASLIFIHRHPLDSLLTNWVRWRTYIREGRMVLGISEVYRKPDAFYADLERSFTEFRAFAEGDPTFFAHSPGPRFLSFAQFVEETLLFLDSASLALRLEDFTVNPDAEFARIFEVMSLDPHVNGAAVDPPRTRPYRYLEAVRRVPRFREWVAELDADTRSRLERIGYPLPA